ncbi:MAG TPA: hypothetical protein VI318_17080 [Baekduia sp.]
MTTVDAISEPVRAGVRRPAALLGAAVALAQDRVPAGRAGRRAVARPDEDAVTLSAQAAARVLPVDLERVGAIVLATTTPPYATGASVQTLAELLGLQGDVFGLELTASTRDGLAAVRVAAGLARPGAPVLVCAAHAAPADRTTGDGAIALLVGDADDLADGGDALAVLTPAAALAVELRDRWRLAGAAEERLADRSFVQTVGTERLARDLHALVADEHRAAPLVVGPDSRGSATVERELGGDGDDVTRHCGVVGAAHPLLRLLAGLSAPRLALSLSNGLGEALHARPAGDCAALVAAIRAELEEGGREADAPMSVPEAADFDPFASGPRAWRDRGVDLRLDGLIGAPPSLPPGRRPPEGTVIAWTRDHVYPGAPGTEMVAVRMANGSQFFGQVAMGETVSIGDPVELVPRLLHHGGEMNQYFWKVKPCR